jgi:threonine/homoserine/homoserine lactone efflux protein
MLAMAPFLSFMAVATVALVIPGPDTFVVLRTALADGQRAGTWAAAGSGLGNLVWGAASVLGVAALLAASAGAFAMVKLVGVGYLVYLGAQALRAAARGDALAAVDRARAEVTRAVALRRGLASDLLNVKVGLFWTALVPQFVSHGSSPLLPAAMVVAMGSLVFAWLAAYAHLAARLTRTLRRRSTARTVNGAVGAAFLVLGAGLALARH